MKTIKSCLMLFVTVMLAQVCAASVALDFSSGGGTGLRLAAVSASADDSQTGEMEIGPLLVWQSGFGKGKHGWAIDVNGNTLAADGNAITLNAATDGSSKGVKLAKSGLSLTNATVLVRYSGYVAAKRRRTLVAFDTAKQTDRWGLGLNADNKLNLFRGTDYDYYTGNACSMAESGTFGVTIVNNGDKCAYVPLADGGTGTYSRSEENATDAITGISIGGIVGSGSSGKIVQYDNLSATITGIAVFDRVLKQTEIENYVWPGDLPPVAGAACIYDWTFTNTLATAAGSQKKGVMTGDVAAKYTNWTNGMNTAVKAFVRPYHGVQIAAGQSVAYYGNAAAKANTILFALGQTGASLFLATGATGSEVVLARTTSSAVSVADSTLETLAGVDDPNGKPHLYVLELSADKTSVKVWVDGTLAATHDFGSAISLFAGVQISGMYRGKPTNWSREENEAECTSAVSALRIFDHALSGDEQAAIVAELKPRWSGADEPKPVITKDEAAKTWTVDTTKGAYAFTSDEIAALKATAWKVTLKSASNLGATVAFGSQTSAQAAHFVIESGTHAMAWLGDAANINFSATGTADNPSILVKDGATLNFTVKDLTGWQGAAQNKTGNLVRVNAGGTLNLVKTANDNTHYYQGRYWLDPGATVTANFGENKFRLNGGAVKDSEQLYVPASDTGSEAAMLTADNGLRLAADSTAGLGVFVGENSKLVIHADITSDGARPLAKWGAGTLEIDGMLTGFTGTLTENAGTLSLTVPTLGGTLAMAAGTTLAVTHDGEVAHGTVVLAAKALMVAEGVKLLVNGTEELYSVDGGNIVIEKAVAEVGGVKYGTLAEAAAAAGNGGKVKLLVEKTAEIDAEFARLAVTAKPNGDGTYTVTFTMAAGATLVFSEIMPKPSDKPYEITTQSGYDKNGLESGWVEVVNTGDKWADLGDYKFLRSNRGKKYNQADYGNFPTNVFVAPGGRYTFYTSERYANSASQPDSAFEHGAFDGRPAFYGDMLIWGDKVNPKKFPMVTLVYRPASATADAVVDTVVVPSDTPEGYSIVVGARNEDSYTQRWLCPSPTFNAPNGDTEGLVRLGPNVGPLYGVKHSEEEFKPTPPAAPGEAYPVTLNVNPVYNGTTNDAIVKVVLKYRTKLDKGVSGEVEMTKAGTDKKAGGDAYAAEIPASAIPSEAGQLIQWKAEITDAAGNVWISPSFNNPDDGYEWYGTITEPGADLTAEHLATWHMFADDDSVAQMDTDADKQSLPNKARVAIYDSSTSNYYDYVRIDLRGNTSAHFNKKSHGLRFAKAHPMTMYDPVRGKTWKEIRKTSLIGEHPDPSRLRQLTSFWLWSEMGNNVPFDFPVRCNLNGKFFQVGFNSERFTDELIEDVYELDKYGYSYKNVGTLAPGSGTTAGKIEKKTPDDGNESDVSVLENELRKKISAAASVNEDNAALTKVVVERFDLPAWLNYLAAARITQEMDDVWANISAYYDNPQMLEGARGTATWMPLGYDFNLSLGQWYYGDARSVGRPTIMSNQDWFKSHPFYGGMKVRSHESPTSTSGGSGNYGIESVLQSSKFRRLFLRRLRTLMDAYLGAPNADETFETTTNPIVVKMKEVAALMGRDGDLDRTTYPWDSSIDANDVWGKTYFPTNITAGIEDIYTNYIVPRRTHLYVTHSLTNKAKTVGYGTDFNAGIPEAQSPVETLKSGFSAAFDATLGVTVVSNLNAEAVDLSGWKLEGPLAMTLPAGAVVDAHDAVYIVADRRAYVAAKDAELTDQIIVGNAAAGKDPAAAIVLKTADDVPVIAPTVKSEQELYLRLWGFCGVPDATQTDVGEFIILTNMNLSVALDASGANIWIYKSTEVADKCHFSLPENTVVPAGGFLRLDQSWEKITDGDVNIRFTAANGVSIYAIDALSQKDLGVKGTGYFAVYDFEKEAWGKMPIADAPGHEEPEPPTPPEPGEGEIAGEYPNGTNIVLTADTVIKIGNATFGKALTISGANATLELKAGATATIPKIVSEKALTVDGAGTLVMSNDAQLVTCAGLTVTNGTVKFTYTGNGAESRAVELTGDYVQYGGAVTMDLVSTNEVYGFWTETKKKVVKILGGTFDTTIDGGAKSATFKLEKGSNDVTLGGGTVNVTLKGQAPRFVQTKAKLDLCGSTVVIAGEAPDARVFKSVETMMVSGGVVKGEATGAGSEIFSADDKIKVEGGVVCVTSADDCFSAQTNIVISAGKVQALSTAGDGIDSNGKVEISGGYVFANTLAAGECGIEADGAFVVKGGTVVAVGGKGMLHAPDAGSVACYTNAAIAKLKKYLVLTSGYADRLERLSVNLKSGEKRSADGFSLIAVVPNMVGTYDETDKKPSDDTPKGEKLDKNLDGVFVTTVEVTPVTPGEGGKTYETEDAAAKAAESAVVLRPENEVTNVIDAAGYAALFDVKPVRAEGGWRLVPALKPSVSNAVQAAVNAAVDAQLVGTLATEPTAKVTTQAGLYYGLAAAEALGEIETVAIPFAKWVLGNGGQQELKADRPGDAAGFYRIRVQATPPAAE